MENTVDPKLTPAFLRLVEVVHELREKCPWDREQTKDTLRHLSVEEVYELSEAILEGNWEEIKVEVGDLLLHILFYAKIGEEQGHFSTAEMIEALTAKLIRRHPHIYGNVEVKNSDEVIQNWEQIKQKEKGTSEKAKKGVLSGVPKGLPALIKAMRMQEKARNVGFDWERADQVWEKVREELGELHAEVKKQEGGEENGDKIEAEFGDLLFSLVNYARFIGVNPEDALERTNRKFYGRFGFLESEVERQGGNLKTMTLAEMDEIWNRAKSTHP